VKAIERKKRWLVALVAFATLVGLSAGTYALMDYYLRPASQRAEQNGTKTVAPIAAKPVSAESKMLVMGDVYWGRYVNDWSMKSDQKYNYPFQRLGEFNRDSYDAWVADMECPVTNNPKVSSVEEDTTLKFDCSPAYLPYAKKYFTAFTLANNHTDNQNGMSGWQETVQNLTDNNIQSFGTYDPEDYNNVCNVLSLPARVTYDDKTVKTVKLPTVWCGHHGVFKTPTAASLAVMKHYTDEFNVIAMPHSGQEYKSSPDQIKTTLYRDMIDNGADVVIGNHAHWIQTSEAYKGHLIIYNLGNFIFDQQDTMEVTRGLALAMTVSVNAKDAPDLEKWAALAEKCGTYDDECLKMATSQKLTKLPLKYTFSVVGSDDSGKQVKPASAAQVTAIKQRLNWSTTVKGLTGMYSGEL
jgi:poly-gamma-glutamate synthesis protein (capsule biosynthesis protein)